MFEAAARVADSQGDIALKSLVLNQLGFEYLDKGRLNEADRAMTEAFRLRLLGRDRESASPTGPWVYSESLKGDLRSRRCCWSWHWRPDNTVRPRARLGGLSCAGPVARSTGPVGRSGR